MDTRKGVRSGALAAEGLNLGLQKQGSRAMLERRMSAGLVEGNSKSKEGNSATKADQSHSHSLAGNTSADRRDDSPAGRLAQLPAGAHGQTAGDVDSDTQSQRPQAPVPVFTAGSSQGGFAALRVAPSPRSASQASSRRASITVGTASDGPLEDVGALPLPPPSHLDPNLQTEHQSPSSQAAINPLSQTFPPSRASGIALFARTTGRAGDKATPPATPRGAAAGAGRRTQMLQREESKRTQAVVGGEGLGVGRRGPGLPHPPATQSPNRMKDQWATARAMVAASPRQRPRVGSASPCRKVL